MQALTGCVIRQISVRLLPSTCKLKPLASFSSPSIQSNSSSRNITMSSGPTYTVEYLSDKLRKSLDAEHVDIEDLSNCGCGMKFDALLVSAKFEGQPILKRQRLVNEILAEEMKHIHALTMQTLTPTQWKDKQAKSQS